jgi:uncharacterized membrane protein
MSDHYFNETRGTHLTYWILGHMLKGAGMALIFVLGLAIVLGLIWGLGQFLPEDSKTSPDPNTWSALVAPPVTAEV